MKRFYQLSLLMLVLILPTLALAHDFEVNGIYYNITSSNTVEVTNGADYYYSYVFIGDVAIPSTVTYSGTTYSVTSIGYSAFSACHNLTRITIPNSVTAIGAYAFTYCSNLFSIDIPISVTAIGDEAFANCSKLTSIEIPNSITSIGDGAFSGCTSMSSITVASDNPYYDSRGNCNAIIETATNTLIAGCINTVIPNTVTSIGSAAFAQLSDLTSIDIPNSVTSIGDEAFYQCSGLTNIDIPNSVTSIGGYAFYQCSGLTNITIPNSITSISYHAFSGCSGLANITIPNSVNSIGDYTFSQCSGLTNIDIPNSVTSIGGYAFSGCSGLANITIPNSVTSIGGSAFSGCSGLANITIPNSVTYIGAGAFRDCSNLTNITIPNSVNSIGDYTFSQCIGLTNIDIPNSVTSIGGYAFSGCSRLQIVNISNSVVSIGRDAFDDTPWYENQPDGLLYAGLVAYKYKGIMPSGTSIILRDGTLGIAGGAFSRCSNLASITFPNSVTSIGDYSFYQCRSLTSIDIPNSVNSIGDYTFYQCRSLTSINIPNSVNSIGDYTFYQCTSLTSIDIPNSVNSIGGYAFSGCSGLANITIPNSVNSIDYYTFSQCSGLTNIIIPNSVTSIGGYAFSGCSRLTDITIPNSVTHIGPFAFYECTGLKDVYSYIANLSLVTMSSDAFSLYTANYSERTLYVPVGSLEAYQTDTEWSQCFGSIVEMEPVLATSIELNQSNVEITESETVKLTANVLPDDATDKTVTWASSDETIATVDVNGLVTAISHGTATITATTADGSDLSASCVINVKSPITPPTVENQFIVSDISAKHGDVVVIPISLINNQTFAAFQTDVFLPEGFSIATDEDDEYIVTASERLTNDHVLMTNDANNGSVRILCYTPNALPISGNEGELFYITIQVPNNAEGLYTITLRNSLMTTTEYQEIGIPDAEGQMEIYSFIPGDVNDSRTVTVTDIVVTAQHVLDMNPSPFIFEAADMNSDGNVTVTDIMLIAYLINHPTMNAPRRMLSLMNVGDRMNGEDVTLMAGETHTVSIALDNISDYTAFQLDLTLPEGLTASNFQLTDRACSHALDVNTLSNGKTRVLCYSPAIETISGHEGALLTFDVTATSEIEGIITVDGIEMVTADCQTALLDDFTIDVNTTTSVNDIPGAKAVLRMDYFNLAGQQIDRPDSGVTLVVITYTDGTRTTSKVMK